MKYIKEGSFAGSTIELNGFTVFNPSHEQYLEAGYEVYTPEPTEVDPEANNEKHYRHLVTSMIREKYTEADELAILRRKLSGDPAIESQFIDYDAFCEECKLRAKKAMEPSEDMEGMLDPEADKG